MYQNLQILLGESNITMGDLRFLKSRGIVRGLGLDFRVVPRPVINVAGTTVDVGGEDRRSTIAAAVATAGVHGNERSRSLDLES